MRQHQRRFIGDGVSIGAKHLGLSGSKKYLDREAQKEYKEIRRRQIKEDEKRKAEKEREKNMVKNALEESMGKGLRDMFNSLQKMGGTAMNKMFERLFIEVSLSLMDKIGVSQNDSDRFLFSSRRGDFDDSEMRSFRSS